MSFLFDKVTTGTYSFVSVTLNVAPDGTTIAGLARAFAVVLAKTKFLDHVKISSTSQLIKGIFKLFQKLLICFSGKQLWRLLMNHYLLVFFLQHLPCI